MQKTCLFHISYNCLNEYISKTPFQIFINAIHDIKMSTYLVFIHLIHPYIKPSVIFTIQRTALFNPSSTTPRPFNARTNTMHDPTSPQYPIHPPHMYPSEKLILLLSPQEMSVSSPFSDLFSQVNFYPSIL